MRIKNLVTSALWIGSVSLLCACTHKACDHQLIVQPFVAPTCGESGLTQGVSCSLCGEILVPQEEIEPLGHSWVTEEVISATESQEGAILYRCERCHDTKEEIYPKLPHIHEYVFHGSVEAKCEEDGSIEFYRCNCGKLFVLKNGQFEEIQKEDITIPRTGHDNHLVREREIPHFEYEQCSHCEKISGFVLPTISITCADSLGADYSSCLISGTNCLEEHRFIDASAQIKVRGNWTSTLNKKPYRIKFDKKQVMFGLNDGLSAKNWVLLADYADKSMVRNAAAFYVANKLFNGNYYSSDCCFVEVYINSEYQGVYLLAEQQQINKKRINIYEDSHSELPTIGYLIENDRYFYKEDPSTVFEIDYDVIPYLNGFSADNSHFCSEYVIKNDITSDLQREFIQSRIQSIWDVSYDALYGDHTDPNINPYKTISGNNEVISDLSIRDSFEAINRIIDVESLVDTYLLNEIIQDMDIGFSSFYFSIDMSEKGNKKLTFQAPWDFDWCFGNSVSNLHQLFLGNYLVNEPNHEKSNPWLLLVSNSQWFWQLMQKKWQIIESSNLCSAVSKMITFFTSRYSYFIQREYGRWPEKATISVWCSSENTLSAKTQEEDSQNVINYLNKRFEWLSYYFQDLSRVNEVFG